MFKGNSFVSVVILVMILCAVAEARGGGGRGGSARNGKSQTSAPSTTRIAICGTQQVSTATSGATQNYGIILSLEPNNGNELAADTYLLDSSLRKVKQIGHAEVTQQSDSASATVLNVTSSPDSPSQFAFLISIDPSNPTSFQGELSTAVLFTGEALNNQMFTCKLPNAFQAQSPSPAPSPSASPADLLFHAM